MVTCEFGLTLAERGVLGEIIGGSDGGIPAGTLAADKDGNLYGTTQVGGAAKAGVAFKLSGTGLAHSASAP